MTGRCLLLLPLLLLPLAACDQEEPRSFQGYVEADLLFVGPDEAGRVTRLLVDEGDRVAAGQALVAVEDRMELAARDQAQANLDEAKARLARLQAAQQRPEEIAVLQAAVDRAQATLVRSGMDLERQQKLHADGNASKAALDAAQAAYDQDKATLAEAQQQVEVAKIPSHALDIDAAQQSVVAAQAALAAAQERLDRRHLTAPAAATVQQVYYRQGEVAGAGKPVVSLLPPGNIKVRFFLPEALLPQVKAGAAVIVTCDGCGAPLTARITFLSAKAEYTPPVIYSLDERSKLVFMIEARPEQPERLRVGQPVSVTLDAPPS